MPFRSVILCTLASASTLTAALTGAQRDFFENRIRPALAKYCYECHSADAKKLGGKLYLDTKHGLLSGGESGPVLVSGNPDDSLLVQSLRWEDTEMPPDEPLPKRVIRDFEKWVQMGAPDPREEPGQKEFDKAANGELHWSLRPIRNPQPKPAENDWARDTIDRFVMAKMAAANLRPSKDASPRTLVRRLYYDLTGLPPSLKQIEEFEQAHRRRPSAATEKLVDDLLASPHFGERWGRHWLDVARYGESNGNDGLSRNATFPHAWRYRDYVIRAFNRDTPYDRFLTEQIAGDLLPAKSDLESDWNKIATGFLALGSKPAKAMNVNFDMDVVADQIGVVSSGIMGLSVGCARCHDHKHDPIPTRDYYALAGIFKSSTTMYGLAANEGLTAPKTPLHELKVLKRTDKPVPEFGLGVPDFAEGYEDAITKLNPTIYSKLDGPHPDLKPERGASMTPEKFGHMGKNGQIRGVVRKPTKSYSVSFWFRNDVKSDSVILTAYLFSFANPAKLEGPGDHLGISGTYKGGKPGKWFVFPGTKKVPSVRGENDLPELTWNHVVMVRDENHVRLQINGAEPLEIDQEIPEDVSDVRQFTLGSRSDKMFSLQGNLTQFAYFDRALSREEAMSLHTASGQAKTSGPKLQGPVKASPNNLAMGVREASNPDDCQININGESQKLGPVVPRGFLSAWTKPKPPIPVPPDKELRPLFEKGLSAARTDGKPKWKFSKGVITGTSKSNERGFLVTKEKFRDFELTGEFELKGKGKFNSGISFRVTGSPAKERHFNLGDPAADQPFGLYFNDWLVKAATKKPIKVSQWNKLRLRVVGQKVEGWINEEKLVDHTLKQGDPIEGAIAFQSHANKNETGTIRFRKLLVQRLNKTERPYSPVKNPRTSGRLELAQWLTDKKHPLTARVFVNRVWHQLMGQPIVSTPDDFGIYGARPTHPDLLDHLATRFMDNGWSMKRLIRDIVLTRTYGLDSNCDSRTKKLDPDNHWLARHNRRRLDAEAIRDSILGASGELDRQPGIGSDVQNLDVLLDRVGKSLHRPSNHRSIYLCMLRNSPPPDLAAFDLPDALEVKGKRDVTLLPTQSLYLLNSQFLVEQARKMARHLVVECNMPEKERVKHAYHQILARDPDQSEIGQSIALVQTLVADLPSKTSDAEISAWAGLCQALLLTSEFRYVD